MATQDKSKTSDSASGTLAHQDAARRSLSAQSQQAAQANQDALQQTEQDPNAGDPSKRLAVQSGGAKEYPRYVYGENGQSAYVASEEERSKLEGSWQDTPPQVEQKQQAPSSPPVQPSLADRQRQIMTNLGPDHTYRDRVEAQARSLGVEVTGEETMEYLMWVIRMKASS
jgi:hypothetical protein